MYFSLATLAQQKLVILQTATTTAQSDTVYTLVDERGKIATDLKLVREGDDLVIYSRDIAQARVNDFYSDQAGSSFSTDGQSVIGANVVTPQTVTASDNVVWQAVGTEATTVPNSWLIGGGAVLAAAAFSDDDDKSAAAAPEVDEDSVDTETIVVFDLIDDRSSNHSERIFDLDTTYTIYILMPDNQLPEAFSEANQWSGGENLGSDDTIVFVTANADGFGLWVNTQVVNTENIAINTADILSATLNITRDTNGILGVSISINASHANSSAIEGSDVARMRMHGSLQRTVFSLSSEGEFSDSDNNYKLWQVSYSESFQTWTRTLNGATKTSSGQFRSSDLRVPMASIATSVPASILATLA